MRRTARHKTLARRAEPLDRATQPTSAPQDNAHLRASDLTAQTHPALGGRELNSRRMNDTPRLPRDVHRYDRRRTKQTDDERE